MLHLFQVEKSIRLQDVHIHIEGVCVSREGAQRKYGKNALINTFLYTKSLSRNFSSEAVMSFVTNLKVHRRLVGQHRACCLLVVGVGRWLLANGLPPCARAERSCRVTSHILAVTCGPRRWGEKGTAGRLVAATRFSGATMRGMNSWTGPLSLCVCVALLFQLIKSPQASALCMWLKSTQKETQWCVLACVHCECAHIESGDGAVGLSFGASFHCGDGGWGLGGRACESR